MLFISSQSISTGGTSGCPNPVLRDHSGVRSSVLPGRKHFLQRDVLKAMSTWWDRKTGHLRYASRGWNFPLPVWQASFVCLHDWWLLSKAHVTEPRPACSPAVSTASQSSDIFTLLVFWECEQLILSSQKAGGHQLLGYKQNTPVSSPVKDGNCPLIPTSWSASSLSQLGHTILSFASSRYKAATVIVKAEPLVHQLVQCTLILKDLFVQVSLL